MSLEVEQAVQKQQQQQQQQQNRQTTRHHAESAAHIMSNQNQAGAAASSNNNNHNDVGNDTSSNKNNNSSSHHRYVGGNNNAASVSIGTKPTLIEIKSMRFLIMDAPRQGNLHVYIKEMRKYHVTHVVRVCESTYQVGELTSAGICLHEMEYKDGTSPSTELIDRWLNLVHSTFFQKESSGAGGGGTEANSNACIAVHCVAGLGRAPVVVAIALIEFANMDPVEAVSYIRERRRGAINEKQLLYLEGYKRRFKKAGAGAQAACCVIL